MLLIPSRLFGPLVGSALLLLAAAQAPAAAADQSPRPSQAPPAAQPTPLPFVPYHEEHPVLAYYYMWWDPENFQRTLFKPLEAYHSDSVSVIRRHVGLAQSAGIDGFIVSWYGGGDRTDVNFQKLLEIGRESGFRATIHFETHLFVPYGVEDVEMQLRTFYHQYIHHPALVTYQGRPVIFFWRASMLDNATWSALRERVDPERKAVWIADGDQFGILTGDAWDGISPYAIAWSNRPGVHLASWAAKARAADPNKLYIPPVSPGCDDTAARPPTCIQDRTDGGYYQQTLDGALAVSPPWAVVVSTFNEWMESTQIEPSTAYGDHYLRMTRAFAGTFRGEAPADAREIPAPGDLGFDAAVAPEPSVAVDEAALPEPVAGDTAPSDGAPSE